jgi:hypothetical protein
MYHLTVGCHCSHTIISVIQEIQNIIEPSLIAFSVYQAHFNTFSKELHSKYFAGIF